MAIEPLDSFLKIIQTKSFAQAAVELKLSESGVRAHITSLEKELGYPLFVKLNQRLILTPHGKHYLQAAKKIRYEQNLYYKKHLSKEKTLRLQLTPTTENLFGTQLIKALTETFPEYHVRFVISNDLPDFSTGEIDMAYYSLGRNLSEDIGSLVIARYNVHLYASEAHINTYGLPKTPADLRQHPLIKYTGINKDLLDLDWFLNLIEPDCLIPTYHVRSTYGLVKLVEAGLGIGSFAAVVAKLSKTKLLHILPQYIGPGHNIYLMYNKKLFPEDRMGDLQRKLQHFLA